MKTKKSRGKKECYLCKGTIANGDQYARKSINVGMQACGSGPVENIPPAAWTPYRINVPVCNPCANPEL